MQDSTEEQEGEMNLKENLRVGWVSIRREEREYLKQLLDFCLAVGGWWDLHWMGSRDDTDSGLRWVGLGVPRIVSGVDV